MTACTDAPSRAFFFFFFFGGGVNTGGAAISSSISGFDTLASISGSCSVDTACATSISGLDAADTASTCSAWGFYITDAASTVAVSRPLLSPSMLLSVEYAWNISAAPFR